MQLDVNKAKRATLALAAMAGMGWAGATTLTHQPDWVVEGPIANAQFGGTINAQGDLNKDGFKDLIVSSGSTSQGTLRGAIEVYYGSRKGPSKTAGWRYEGALSSAVAAALTDGRCVLGAVERRDYHGNVVPARTAVAPGTKGSLAYANRLRSERGEPPLVERPDGTVGVTV